MITLSAAELKLVAYIRSKEGIMTCNYDCNATQYFIPDIIQRLDERFKK